MSEQLLQFWSHTHKYTSTTDSCIMQTHATMYCKYYKLQVLYTLFSPILGQVYALSTDNVVIVPQVVSESSHVPNGSHPQLVHPQVSVDRLGSHHYLNKVQELDDA